ncbi:MULTISPECIES: glycosyltransferase family 2 protein [unclassified Saccharibacter]|uniref:glycosyltransferase family 2 protein n=1 Tax=unclassified Saccharibacter TaxID=2648722 RepID=UPI00132BFCC8|nr:MULTISPECIES: glycosyltransferase family 2 protein [unclassified Saccharibacter]MXV35373.1 hypothetical protein [Saccharibacter sp. EH611]MXV57779.1 hypothetical protein [Saccharibacter sp. EH70]MXV65307.1 hypothetical protein [Saccharibacter sp. EH60]
MPVVKVLMMQKDEGPRLARWLTHYGQIFGMKNLILFDNGSQDPFTLALLKEAERHGCHVRYDLTSTGDFREKGQHFTNVIASLDHDVHYDFALPVDCDELLCAFTEDGLSLQKEAIYEELERLKPCRGPLTINLSLFNVPQQEGWYAPRRLFPKGFVPARCGARIDNGHHFPTSQEEPNSTLTRFTYLHNHHRPYQEMINRAKAKLALEVNDISDLEELREHESKGLPGGHLVRTILQNRRQYNATYNNEVQLYFRGNGILLRRPREKEVHIWDSQRYLERHPDTASYVPGPLSHYLTYGAPEGRELP